MASQRLIVIFSIFCVVSVILVESSDLSHDIIVFPDNLLASRVSTETNPGISEEVAQLSRSAREFFLIFLRNLFQNPPSNGTNVCASPLSVWSSLLFLAEGASDSTYEQLAEVLRLPEELMGIGKTFRDFAVGFRENSTAFGVDMAQVLFYDVNRPPNNEYHETLEYVYGADLHPVDLLDTTKTVDDINNYIKQKTRNNIDHIVELRDLNVNFLMPMSAVSFQKYVEKSADTSIVSQPFYNERDELVAENVPYLVLKGTVHKLYTKIIELALDGNPNLSMIIALPAKFLSIQTFYDKVENVHVNSLFLILNLIKKKHDAQIYLPQFSASSKFKLNKALQRMGLKDVFSGSGNFSKMTPHRANISISQKTMISLRGKDMADTNATITNDESFSQENVHIVNRPFAFMIVEKKTQSILLGGVIQDPRIDVI